MFLYVYCPHEDFARRRLWSDLVEVHSLNGGRCCLMRDFNVVRNQDERRGSVFYQRRAAIFNEFIHATGLQELKLSARRFTWIGMGGMKLSKLDRFLVSPDLLNEWPAVYVTVLERTFADHCPLLKSSDSDYGPIPFRFFDHWMLDEDFNVMVISVWERSNLSVAPMVSLKNKLKLLKSEIKLWRANSS